MELDGLITFAMNNGVGVFFGFLLYKMADGTIKKNTEAIEGLRGAVLQLAQR